MKPIKPKKGYLLVAEPSIIGDMSFNRSVVLLTEYNEEGAVGFILNKPLDFILSDFVEDLDASFTVYNGGPVEQENLYFIHNVPHLIPDSIEISDGIYWGGDFNVIIELIKQKQIDETQIRFFLGYSGWSKDQLEQELSKNTWVVIPNNHKESLFLKDNPDFWKEKMIEFGGDYVLWSNAPENPALN